MIELKAALFFSGTNNPIERKIPQHCGRALRVTEPSCSTQRACDRQSIKCVNGSARKCHTCCTCLARGVSEVSIPALSISSGIGGQTDASHGASVNSLESVSPHDFSVGSASTTPYLSLASLTPDSLANVDSVEVEEVDCDSSYEDALSVFLPEKKLVFDVDVVNQANAEPPTGEEVVTIDSFQAIDEAFKAVNDSLKTKTDYFNARLYPAIEKIKPVTVGVMVAYGDFEALWRLLSNNPESFYHVQGFLFCLFHYGLDNRNRKSLDDIDFESLGSIIEFLKRREKSWLLDNCLICLYALLYRYEYIMGKQAFCNAYEAVIKKMIDSIMHELKSRYAYPPVASILMRLFSRDPLLREYRYLIPDFIVMFSEGDTYWLMKHLNSDEETVDFFYLYVLRKKEDELAANVLVCYAILKKDEILLQDLIDNRVLFTLTSDVFLSRQLLNEYDEELLYKVAGRLNIKIDVSVARKIVKDAKREIIPLSYQALYQLLTGEEFSGTEIFGEDPYKYDYKAVLSSVDAFDTSPESYCKKNPIRSTLYEWSIRKNTLRLVRGIERPFTGKYKLVLDAHGNGLTIVEEFEGRNYGYRGETVAIKMDKLLKDRHGDQPAKITLSHCNIGLDVNKFGFRQTFVKKLAALGYETVVSAPAIGSVSSSETTGRKVYSAGASYALGSLSTGRLHRLRHFGKVQTKDKKELSEYKQMLYRQAHGMKVVYKIKEGAITKLPAE